MRSITISYLTASLVKYILTIPVAIYSAEPDCNWM